MSDLLSDLDALRGSLPTGVEFVYDVRPDEFRLLVLGLISGMRGSGTRLLATALSLADRAGVRTTLLVDPTDDPEDPSTFDLVRWYSRFGFEMTELDDWGRPRMAREPEGRDMAGILAAYAERKADDLTWTDYESLLREAPMVSAFTM